MLIIPEIETIVILTPRTGSGSTYRAVLAKYPKAILLYRHMEADGVPFGYDRWPKVGVVRDPIARLWSLYKFLQDFEGPYNKMYINAMRLSVDRPFNDWLLNNEIVFNSAHLPESSTYFDPKYSVRNQLPENKKSQFIHLRPDLGTEIFQFNNLKLFEQRLGITLGMHNKTDIANQPELTDETGLHMEKWFSWDFVNAWSES